MIGKREILDVAEAVGLRPQVVEKDYALGWVLAGIGQHPAIRDSWLFKGGTCLKKCFFETYRFSEDLDFTLLDAVHLDEAFLNSVFAEISEWVYEQSGVELPLSQQKFEVFQNPRGQEAAQGRLGYRGPIGHQSDRQLQRIKLDLTSDEKIVLPGERIAIHHEYSDIPPEGIRVLAYAYVEAFAEKVRALAERTRPRDLYDVVNLFRNEEARPPSDHLRQVLREKCDFKGIGLPAMSALVPHREGLEAAWQSMLAHQLPALPPPSEFWNVLPEFFDWLLEDAAPATLEPWRRRGDEQLVRSRSFGLGLNPSERSIIDTIRFAGANRLCLDVDYAPESGRPGVRRVEPYSLRQSLDGSLLVHVEKADGHGHRSYRLDRIRRVEVTSQSFVPRHKIELHPSGPIVLHDVSSRQ